MVIIDDRLLDAKSEQQLIVNFNRTLQALDTLAEVVADIDESQLYKVVFDSKGGSAVPNQYIIEGDKAVEPTDPTKAGYTFSKWMNGNKEYDFDSAVTTHLTLDATWTANEYTITYDLDGGNLAEGVTNPLTYTIETDTFTLNNPTKEGYTFQGWTGSNGDVAQAEVSVAKGSYGNKTFTANWQEVVQQEG